MRYAIVLLMLFALVNVVEAAPHWEVDVSWTQPAPTTQTGYRIERKIGLTGTYQSLTPTPLAATVRTFRDVGPYQDGQVVCHRAVALAPAGAAAAEVVFDEVCSGAPIQIPGKGTLQQQWQFIAN